MKQIYDAENEAFKESKPTYRRATLRMLKQGKAFTEATGLDNGMGKSLEWAELPKYTYC
jgi:hypothetical protein